MGKKTLTIALAAVFALALTLSLGGCGGKDKGGGEPDSMDIVIGAPDSGGDSSGGAADAPAGGGDSGGAVDSPAGGGDSGGAVDSPAGGGDSGDLDLNEQYSAGEWPDNELTRQVPKPGFKPSSGYARGGRLLISFEGLSLDDAKAYAKQLEEAGFTVDSFIDDRDDDTYIYSGSNSSGYSVTFTWTTKIDPHIIIEKG